MAMADEPLAGRLAWITGLRLAFLTLLLVATAFFYLGGELSSYPFSLRIVFGTIGAAYALAAVYAAVLRSKKKLWLLAQAQIVLDQLTWTAIVYVSGGATSGATSFYALTCLVGAILIGLRGAAIAAISGLGFYWLLCAGFHFRWVPAPPDQPAASYATAMSALSYPLLVNGLGILVVAVLAGYLAERLRITGGELKEATVRAHRAEHLAELGRIAAWLAHEVRNPLGSIKGSIEMLRESSALSTEDKQLCDIVHREAARLNDLVGDMLDLSKPRAAEPNDVDVASLAREVVELAKRAGDEGGVAIAYVGAGSAIAWCDGAQMRQVLWNLVRNAVQASPAGSKVTVQVAKVTGGIALRVADSGPGISDEAKKRIFDAFYTTRSHGAGIGLAVVKRIVDEHAEFGARISVDNLEGRGAEFRVFLRSVGHGAR
ncbi:MAG: Two-component sensor PilS [Myxococcaceae bacterium]|nr:Two-component sensor PilS [Myxococcaceae bacterium]